MNDQSFANTPATRFPFPSDGDAVAYPEFEIPLHCFVSRAPLSGGKRRISSKSAVELHAYANRVFVQDHRGNIRDYRRAGRDWVGSRIYFPPDAATAPAHEVWLQADKAAAATGKVVIISNHLICRLPAGNSDTDGWFSMIQEFAQTHFMPVGLIAEASIHVPEKKSPHVHWQVSCMTWSENKTFTSPIYDATSPATRARWQQGWIALMKVHAAVQFAVCEIANTRTMTLAPPLGRIHDRPAL